jgi:hypothetical protein
VHPDDLIFPDKCQTPGQHEWEIRTLHKWFPDTYEQLERIYELVEVRSYGKIYRESGMRGIGRGSKRYLPCLFDKAKWKNKSNRACVRPRQLGNFTYHWCSADRPKEHHGMD